jgi:hypothetical protein
MMVWKYFSVLTWHKGGRQAAKSLQGQLNRIRNGTFRDVSVRLLIENIDSASIGAQWLSRAGVDRSR